MEEFHPYYVNVTQYGRKYIVKTHVSTRLRGELRKIFEQLYRDIIDDILDCDEKGEECPSRYEGFVYESSYVMKADSKKRKIPQFLPFVKEREYNFDNPQVVMQERQKNIRDVRKLDYYEGCRTFSYPKNITTIAQVVVGSVAKMDIWVNKKRIGDYNINTMIRHDHEEKTSMNNTTIIINDNNNIDNSRDPLDGGKSQPKYNTVKPDNYHKPEDIKSRNATSDDIVEIIDDGKVIEELNVPRVVPTNFKIFTYLLPENRSDKGGDGRVYHNYKGDPDSKKNQKTNTGMIKGVVSDMELKDDNELLKMLHDYNDDITRLELLQAYPELTSLPDPIIDKCVLIINKYDRCFIELLESENGNKRARLSKKGGHFCIPKNTMMRAILDTEVRTAIEKNLDDMDTTLIESELKVLEKTDIINSQENMGGGKDDHLYATIFSGFIKERWDVFGSMSLQELAPIIAEEISYPGLYHFPGDSHWLFHNDTPIWARGY